MHKTADNFVNHTTLNKTQTSNYNFSKDEFPAVERVPIEKMKDAYSTLLSNYKSLVKDRETILSSLRNETITNEEQRNYIELLKQTIEDNILKAGMSHSLNTQK